MAVVLGLGAGAVIAWIAHDYFLPQNQTIYNQGISATTLIEGIAIAGVAIMVYEKWR